MTQLTLSELKNYLSQILPHQSYLVASRVIQNFHNRVEGLSIDTHYGTIEIKNVRYVPPDKDLRIGNWKKLRDLKIKGGTYEVRVYADVILRKKGKTIKKRYLISRIPIPTRMGTWIVGGKEMIVGHMMRRAPGTYVVETSRGPEIQFNLKVGRNFQIVNDDGILLVEIGTQHFSAYNLAKALGIHDEKLRKWWGDEVLEANKEAASGSFDSDIRGIVKALNYGKDFGNIDDNIKFIRDYMRNRVQMDPSINKMTVGAGVSGITNELFLKATSKMIKVMEGKDKPHHYNDLRYKTFHAPHDLIIERMNLMWGDVVSSIKRRLRRAEDPKQALPSGHFSKIFYSFFSSTRLGTIPDMNNPIDIIGQQFRVSPLGEGGYTDPRTIPITARFFHGSSLGVLDPLYTPEGHKTGLISHLTGATTINKGKAWIKLYDPKRKREVYVPHTSLRDKIVALPGEMGNKVVWAIDYSDDDPKPKRVPAAKVDFYMTGWGNLLAPTTLLLPNVNRTSIPRLAMATKHEEQALSLVNPEPPLIMGIGHMDKTINKAIDEALGRRSPVDGIVESIKVSDTESRITILGDNGKKYIVDVPIRYPLNNQAVLTATKILVSKGQRVKKGQPLFETNFHKNGIISLGVNLRVGYLMKDFATFKDGIVISESAAKKLASHRVASIDIPKGDVILSLEKAKSAFPTIVPPEKLSKLDERGIVKKGVTINPGDVIFFGVRKTELTPEDIMLGRISKALKQPLRPVVLTWEKLAPGKVIEVSESKNKYVVFIETVEPAKPGDKIAGRYGNKGVITKVLPDDEMPRDEDGNPLEVIISPLAIPTRTNPSQLVETALGQWAEKTGKPIVIDPFDQTAVDILEDLIRKKKIKPTKTVRDPKTGKEVKAITGKQYFLRLMHTSDFGLSGRGFDEGYDVNMQPVTGSKGGAKKLGWLMQAALLAHGAGGFLEQARFYTSTRNPEFWRALLKGLPLPAPKPTFATQKFFGLLSGAHIKPILSTGSVQLSLLTDDDIEQMSRKVPRPTAMLFGSTLKPERGGLFDPAIFRGISGDLYGHFDLPERLPNPIAKPAIQAILGLTPTDFNAVIAGKLGYDPSAKEFRPDGKIRGPEAIAVALDDIDIEREISSTKSRLDRKVMSARKDPYDSEYKKLARKLRYLRNLKKWLDENPGKKPSDLYTNKKVLVIPPKFRPIYPTESGDLVVSDINHLIRETALMAQSYEKIKNLPVDEEQKNALRKKMYESFEALVGLGTPIGPVPARGALAQIQGTVNKGGFYQAHVIKVSQDVSGRGVLGVDPSLKLDEIGIPEPLAWKIFKPMILKELMRMGMSMSDAAKHYSERSDMAREALKKAVEDAYVIANRAPTLHKQNILSFRPKVYFAKDPTGYITEQQIRFNPAVFEGYNADLDGDQISVFVPVTPKAIEDASRMLPSKNAVQYGHNWFLMLPEEEAMATLYRLSVPGKKTGKKFKSFEDLEKASRLGVIGGNEVVLLRGKETWYGREVLKKLFGKYWDGKTPLNKRLVHKIMLKMYREDPSRATQAVNEIMDIVKRHMYDTSFTFPIEELIELRKKKRSIKDPNDLIKKAPPTLKEMMTAQVRGKPYQYFVLGVRVNDKDPNSRSFFEGLSPKEFLDQINPGRAGLVGRAIETALPGELTKASLAGMLPVRIMDFDGPDPGIEMSLNDPDIIDRYIARDVRKNGKIVFKKDTLIDEAVVKKAKSLGLETLPVRSPLSSSGGIWSKSFGLLDDGRLPTPEEHIGFIATHALMQPATQMTLNKFHTKVTRSPLDDLMQFLKLPQSKDKWALLSPYNGTIKEIVQIRKRRYIVLEDGRKIPVPKGKKLLVTPGTKIKKGMKLTTGEIDPRDIADLQGILPARIYLTEKIHKTYESAGIPIRRRFVETFVRGMSSYVKIEDPGDTPLLPGDVIHESEYDAWVNRMKKEGKKPPIGKNIISGVSMAPYLSSDFLTRLVAGRIKSTLVDGALLGWKSDIHSLSPIPQMVLGPINLADMDPEETLTV